MIFVFGSRLYGKVDVVPGLFHVETRFGHFDYVPLFPLESFVIFNKNGDNFNGVKIPLSFKSICYAWLRTATLVGALISLLFCVIEYKSNPSNCLTASIVGLSSLATCGVLSFHKGSTHASYRRAYQLAELIQLSPEGFLYLDQLYNPAQEETAEPLVQENTERFNADL
jgi:hypothetical protein